ncbi:30S ribosomal protein S11 [Candidatus Nomurabacteria bacterium]|nr:30S ribosomal protein S11 [Candidatus Nomurabacteria bacterium]
MAEPTTTEVKKPSVSRKKQRRSVPSGQMHIQASFNNTIVTFTDKKGAVLCASSAGACGFRGSKKGTAYAAQVAAEKAAEMAKTLHGMKTVDVFVKGVGLGRDSAIRAVSGFDMQVDSIKDVTGVPHGGTRPRKVRRV